MSPTITFHDILAWLEPMPDDAIVGTPCNNRDCVVARYARAHTEATYVSVGLGTTFRIRSDGAIYVSKAKGLAPLFLHSTEIDQLIIEMDREAQENDIPFLTAGYVREVAARIIRDSQPGEADDA